MRSRHGSVALLSSGILWLAGCSSGSEPIPGERSPNRESLGATSGGDLGVKVLSVETSGELCPPKSFVKVEDFFVSVVPDVSATCEEPESYDPPLESLEASCSVVVELEVPEGHQVAAPRTEWEGYVTGDASVTRSYGFENGATVSTPSTRVSQNLFIEDRGLAALSPTCSLTRRTRLVAALRAAQACKGQMKLDAISIYTTWKAGTHFEDCAGGPGDKTDGLVGEWCGGTQQRPCVSGLACEFTEASLNSDGSGRQGALGTCVDPNERPRTAEEGETCGGVTDIPCAAGSVCWHMPDSGPNWRGRCVHDPLPEGGSCHFGAPRLDCATPFVCYEPTHECVNARGLPGDPCGEPYLPDCVAPAFCQQQTAGTRGNEITIALCTDISRRQSDDSRTP